MERREELFWKKVNKNGPNGCWIWLNECHHYHGMVTFKGWRTGAHRVAFTLVKGTIPEGLSVLHKCDNGRCVNPDHLFLGTQQDNIADMIAKGRNYKLPPLKGEKHGMCKLSFAQCEEIRSLYASGGYSQWYLAHKFSVGQSQIGRIIKRQNRATR